ncbi:MAG: MATE family efflux transporter [Myxococcales bacterium]|nr:MATE family efflux transporter [Myxococcales bacterium]MDD9964769.1 MATE family efflux transporter [Myxococcales bacterium]
MGSATAGTKDEVGLGVWQLAWPTSTTFALHALVGIVDFLIVSELGADAVAAVGIGSQVQMMQFSLFASVTMGTTALVARAVGARELDEADRVLRTSMALTAGLGVACVAAVPLADETIALFGVTPSVAALATDYFVLGLLFSAPMGVSIALGNGLRAAGDVRTPLLFGVVSNSLNVVLDYGLVFGKWGFPAMGVRGAALASGLAISIGTALVFVLWAQNRLALRPRGCFRGVSWEITRRLFRIGLPSAAEGALFNVGILAFTGIIARFGTAAVGAYFIGVRILAFSFVPGIGFQVAASTLVGQHLGAQNPEEARRAGWRATMGAMGVMSVVGLSIVLLSEPMAGWFGASGARTVELAVVFIWILGAAQPLMAAEFALGGALRGAGDTRFPLLAVVSGLFGGRLLAAMMVIHVFSGSVIAVWCCLFADYGIKATLLSTRFASGRWQTISV